MSDRLFDAEDDASTPLNPEERDALIPSYITQRRELNEVEQIGIADADRWAFARRGDILSEDALCALHRRMFGAVWKWAAQFRATAPEHRRRRPPHRAAAAAVARRRGLLDRPRHLRA